MTRREECARGPGKVLQPVGKHWKKKENEAVTRCGFGPFVFDPANRRLLRDGVPVPITARVFDLLVAFIAHAGQAIEKDDLVRLVWGDVAIEEGNLARHVSTLRKVLGEQADDRRYIVTLPGRGYQFVAQVRPLASEDPQPPAVTPAERRATARVVAAALVCITAAGAAAWWVQRVRVPAEPSRLAVLPFKNLGAPDDEYFSRGMTEEITTRLSSARSLQVISRTTADRYAAMAWSASRIASELGADYLMEGSIRWDRDHARADRIRVTAQLVRASDDTQLWSEVYDRELDDLFEVQADIARRVAIELRGAVAEDDAVHLERPPTASVDAYRAFAKGRFFAGIPNLSEAHLTRVVAEFQRAVDLDPQFALAYAGLSRAHETVYRFGYDVSDGRKQLAARALERAEALAPESSAVLLARSRYSSTIGGDHDRAVRAAEAAERLRPGDPAVVSAVANARFLVGHWPQAAEGFERAVRLDPHSPTNSAMLGLIYTALRRHADAQGAIERSLQLEPDQSLANIVRTWNVWLWRGDLPAARAYLDSLKGHDDWRFMELRFLQALHERRFDHARAVLEPFAGQWMRDWVLTRPVVLLEAQAWRLQGDDARARAAFERARDLLAREAAQFPSDGRIRSSLAVAFAGLGRIEEARREARRALECMPVPRGLDTASVREDAALAFTMIGDHDAALSEIVTLLDAPAFFTPHVLRLDPRWEPLRSHPRYAALAGPPLDKGQ
jgi:TolB-like protein/DNA-binding winged helix-turn-helix (wHTH) protein/Flp pilus assembly protein TadD